MRKTLFISLITISGYCSANDYFDQKYYSDVYCLKLKNLSKKIAYDKPNLEKSDDEAELAALEAAKAAKKASIAIEATEMEVTDDQREDVLHVIDIVYDNNYYYINEYFEDTYRYCIDKYITKR